MAGSYNKKFILIFLTTILITLPLPVFAQEIQAWAEIQDIQVFNTKCVGGFFKDVEDVPNVLERVLEPALGGGKGKNYAQAVRKSLESSDWKNKNCILIIPKMIITKTEPHQDRIEIEVGLDISLGDYRAVCYDKILSEQRGKKCELGLVQSGLKRDGPVLVGKSFYWPLYLPAERVPADNYKIIMSIWKPGNVGNPEALKEGKCHYYKYSGQPTGPYNCADVDLGSFEFKGEKKAEIITGPIQAGAIQIKFPTEKLPGTLLDVAGWRGQCLNDAQGTFPFIVVDQNGNKINSLDYNNIKLNAGAITLNVKQIGYKDLYFIPCYNMKKLYDVRKNSDRPSSITITVSAEGYETTSANLEIDWGASWSTKGVSATPSTQPQGTTTEKEVKSETTETVTKVSGYCTLGHQKVYLIYTDDSSTLLAESGGASVKFTGKVDTSKTIRYIRINLADPPDPLKRIDLKPGETGASGDNTCYSSKEASTSSVEATAPQPAATSISSDIKQITFSGTTNINNVEECSANTDCKKSMIKITCDRTAYSDRVVYYLWAIKIEGDSLLHLGANNAGTDETPGSLKIDNTARSCDSTTIGAGDISKYYCDKITAWKDNSGNVNLKITKSTACTSWYVS